MPSDLALSDIPQCFLYSKWNAPQVLPKILLTYFTDIPVWEQYVYRSDATTLISFTPVTEAIYRRNQSQKIVIFKAN